MTRIRRLTPFLVLAVLPACGVLPSRPDVRAAGDCDGPAVYSGPAGLERPVALPVAASAGPVRPFEGATAAGLDAALATAVARSGAQSISAAVLRPGQGAWSGRGGDGTRPLAHWASAGKMFTAVAVLQLIDEGRLSLDDEVSRWIEGVPNGDIVTIRNLLDHTSGLYSANEDPDFRRDPRILSLEEELAILMRHGAMFCPGTAWRYSNSNYALLGAVLERVDGRPYAEIVARRIIRPLGLSRTRVAVAGDPLADVTPAAAGGPGDIAADPRRAGAAGGIVAPADEMVLFLSALMEARLTSRAGLGRAFDRLHPMFGKPEYYGLGVMAYRLPGRLLLGHSGGGGGLKAVVLYDPDRDAYVAVSVSGAKGAEPTALLLLDQLGDGPPPAGQAGR